MARVSTFVWDVTSNERFKKAVSAAGGIGQHGEKGFLDAVCAGLGYKGDEGPLRRQVQEKLRHAKNASTFLWDVTSNERFKKVVSAAGGIGQHGEKGFLDAVRAGLGYKGDDGPLRRQVQEKLRHAKNAAAETETPEAKQERNLMKYAQKATVVEKKRLRASGGEEEVKQDEEREESVVAAAKRAKRAEVAEAWQAKQEAAKQARQEAAKAKAKAKAKQVEQAKQATQAKHGKAASAGHSAMAAASVGAATCLSIQAAKRAAVDATAPRRRLPTRSRRLRHATTAAAAPRLHR